MPSMRLNKLLGRSIGQAWKRYRNFGRKIILNMLIRPYKDRGRVDQAFRRDSVAAIRGVIFNSVYAWTLRDTWTPRYLKVDTTWTGTGRECTPTSDKGKRADLSQLTRRPENPP
ncbi:hypothetical protein GDO81_024851 [Engystomops pustulosus]|uniref:Uncharacterized protein n=1 Tax=Engystomops pustulosus TaxID=76066 RepID=A0AAV6YJ58_ENGPU|nr:hypothetical protein GDO81_024851 [Engystomops pustulosus]